MMLAGQADVFEDASHAIPRADATEPVGDVPAAVRPSVLPADQRRTRADAGENGAGDWFAAYVDASGARARHVSESGQPRWIFIAYLSLKVFIWLCPPDVVREYVSQIGRGE